MIDTYPTYLPTYPILLSIKFADDPFENLDSFVCFFLAWWFVVVVFVFLKKIEHVGQVVMMIDE